MEIRCYRSGDLETLLQLFQDTVLTVNARDYPPDQLIAWVASAQDHEAWAARMEENVTLVVEADGEIIAFGELTEDGIIHTLFVHNRHQRQGVAKALLKELERWAYSWEIERLFTEASLTARPFFSSQGYHLLNEQRKPVRGKVLVNFRMEKVL